ncbi:MAG: ester cyclase [Gammaproteobacteria bacterium]|nr:ester cyclase [Gammaproteobacteria bacterium]
MEHNKTIIRQFIDETLNKGDIEAAEKFVAKDVIEQVPFPGQGPGIEGLKDVLAGMRAAFPDMHWTVQEQIAEGDKVVSRFEWTGTHRGPFLGVEPTGRPVQVWGIVIDRLQDGKIKNTCILMDALGLMAQLGVFAPQPAKRPGAA